MPRDYGYNNRRSNAGKARQRIIDLVGTVIKWVLVIILIMFFVSLVKKAYNIGYDIFSDQPMAAKGTGQSVTVEIGSGMSVDAVGRLLEEKGLIKDGSVFKYQEKFSSDHGKISPGVYTLSTEMTPQEIIEKISGEAKSESASTEQPGTQLQGNVSESETEGTEGAADSIDAADNNDNTEAQ